jgi:hypothetical protein
MVEKGYLELYSEPGSVYEQPAPLPPMEWKQNPANGIIIGTITDASGDTPVVDVQVRRNGSDFVALSSGDGLYSFLEVPPDQYTLTYRKKGFLEHQVEDIFVTRGQVTRVDMTLERSAPSADPSQGPQPMAATPATTPAEADAPPATTAPQPPATAPVTEPTATRPAAAPSATQTAAEPGPMVPLVPPVETPRAPQGRTVLIWSLFIILLAAVIAVLTVALYRLSLKRRP